MASFLVERYLAGWSGDRIARLVTELRRSNSRFDDVGVQYCGSIVLPGDETCLCLFEAIDADAVIEVNERLGFPADRVVSADLQLTGTSAGDQPSGNIPS
jgi:hypothetical protein